jgi:hypothetical protein
MVIVSTLLEILGKEEAIRYIQKMGWVSTLLEILASEVDTAKT